MVTFSGKLAAPLAAIALPCVLAACGGAGSAASTSGSIAPAPAVIAAPGEWTSAQVSTFEAASGEGQCISSAISNAVSYGDAMALAKIAPADAKLSTAQVRAAMDKKYGNSEGDAIYNEIIAVGADNDC
jgi:hypothetical protein